LQERYLQIKADDEVEKKLKRDKFLAMKAAKEEARAKAQAAHEALDISSPMDAMRAADKNKREQAEAKRNAARDAAKLAREQKERDAADAVAQAEADEAALIIKLEQMAAAVLAETAAKAKGEVLARDGVMQQAATQAGTATLSPSGNSSSSVGGGGADGAASAAPSSPDKGADGGAKEEVNTEPVEEEWQEVEEFFN
jgi:hypothetical protein